MFDQFGLLFFSSTGPVSTDSALWAARKMAQLQAWSDAPKGARLEDALVSIRAAILERFGDVPTDSLDAAITAGYLDPIDGLENRPWLESSVQVAPDFRAAIALAKD